MTSWWSSLGLAAQFFYAVAVLSSVVLLVQLALSILGAGGDDVAPDGLDAADGAGAAADVGHAGVDGHSSGLGMLSFRTVMAFMVGFGWAGALSLSSGLSLALAVPVAAGVGLVLMVGVFYMMRAIYGLSDSGNISPDSARGATGSVYLPVPAAGKGQGQVQVKIQGRLREIQAVTDGEEALATGTPVRVERVLDGGTVVVRRLEVGDGR